MRGAPNSVHGVPFVCPKIRMFPRGRPELPVPVARSWRGICYLLCNLPDLG